MENFLIEEASHRQTALFRLVIYECKRISKVRKQLCEMDGAVAPKIEGLKQ